MEDLNSFRAEVEKKGRRTRQLQNLQIAHVKGSWDSTPVWIRIIGNLILNLGLIVVSGVTAYIFCALFAWEMQALGESSVSVPPSTELLQEMAIITTMAGSILFALQDLIRLLDRKLKLPFEFSLNKASSIYWSRTQIYLLAVSFNAILLCLYFSFPSMVLISAVFLAAVFSLAILAIQKSVPSARLGFLSSLFFFAVVIATIPIVHSMYSPVDTSNEDRQLLLDD
ncbi:MAG: hypothetical protein QNJ46_21840 [Leptolyngbyaceae cyanobacterium MO_188.B28]|nr:hypothetical protein [Leptolyngbyaceae cyanobacterium MO_188.B28]